MAVALVAGRLLLAGVFVVAGVAKLRDLPGSRRAVAEFGVPAGLSAALGTLLPLAELAVAGALLAGPARWGALSALALLILFCVAIVWSLSRGRSPDCHCFGQLHSSPASGRTVARNLALALVAFLLAVGLGALTPAVALAGVGIASLSGGLALARPRRRLDRVWDGADSGAPEGLPIGAPAPDFRLPGLTGGIHTLDSLRAAGSPVLLLFSDPDCGPCIAMAPEVARWQREHSEELTIAVIENDRGGDATAPDEHGRRNVLLQRESEVADAYDARGTPTGFLVGRDGAIAGAAAAGSQEIEALVARSVTGFEPRQPSVAPESLRPGWPLRRRELLVGGAGAWAATSVVLAWPLRAVAGVGSRRQRLVAESCRDSFDCPETANMGCVDGRCRCDQGFTRCDPEEATDRKCFDLKTHRDHCGGCNRPCAGDYPECCDGQCGEFLQTRCNCGRGGNRCNDDGVCSGDPPQCVQCSSAGMRRCGNLCGNPETQICCGDKIYYKFQLPPGDWTCCGPQGRRRLVDTRENEKHCGGCNKPCGKGKFCYQRRCRKSCPPGLKRCGNTCGDPRTQVCCKGRVYEKKYAQSNEDCLYPCSSRCKLDEDIARRAGTEYGRCCGPGKCSTFFCP